MMPDERLHACTVAEGYTYPSPSLSNDGVLIYVRSSGCTGTGTWAVQSNIVARKAPSWEARNGHGRQNIRCNGMVPISGFVWAGAWIFCVLLLPAQALAGTAQCRRPRSDLPSAPTAPRA